MSTHTTTASRTAGMQSPGGSNKKERDIVRKRVDQSGREPERKMKIKRRRDVERRGVMQEDRTRPPAKKTPGMMTIYLDRKSKARPSKQQTNPDPTVMVIERVVDMKKTRHDILTNWRSFTAADVVRLHKTQYLNLRSAAVMISRLKGELAALEDPPPETYLSKLALSKKDYNEIRAMSSEARKKGAMDVVTISNGDSIVLQSMQYITSSDPNLLIAALFPLTGMRPIEIVKLALFQTKLNNNQEHQSFWACQTRFAKRGTMKTKYNECRDRPFLVPYWLVERALTIVRKRWPTKDFTNRQISCKYSSHWQKILQKAYPQLPGITARLCRRFFAVYSFKYFGKSVFIGGQSQASLNGYASWVLGHATLEDQVIAYSSLIVRPMPKLKLFEVGSNLKVETPRTASTPMQNAPVIKVD